MGHAPSLLSGLHRSANRQPLCSNKCQDGINAKVDVGVTVVLEVFDTMSRRRSLVGRLQSHCQVGESIGGPRQHRSGGAGSPSGVVEGSVSGEVPLVQKRTKSTASFVKRARVRAAAASKDLKLRPTCAKESLGWSVCRRRQQTIQPCVFVVWWQNSQPRALKKVPPVFQASRFLHLEAMAELYQVQAEVQELRRERDSLKNAMECSMAHANREYARQTEAAKHLSIPSVNLKSMDCGNSALQMVGALAQSSVDDADAALSNGQSLR